MKGKLITSECEEVWKPVVGYEAAYEVSNCGRVRSLDRPAKWVKAGIVYSRLAKGRILSPGSCNGYLSVCLYHEGEKTRSFRVAYLVARAFIGERPPKFDVCHNDGDRRNNSALNLRYDTHANNEADKITHDTRPRGERSGTAKLTQEQVDFIRQNCGKFTQSDLAARFGIDRSSVSNIQRGVTWRVSHSDAAYSGEARL